MENNTFAAIEGVYRILIVSKDMTVITRLSGLIAKQYNHCLVGSAADIFEAGMRIISFEPDLVIVEAVFPGSDGFEICVKIKTDPKTKDKIVLVLTGYDPENLKEKILNSRADGYLSEPFDIKQISSYLNEFGVNSAIE